MARLASCSKGIAKTIKGHSKSAIPILEGRAPRGREERNRSQYALTVVKKKGLNQNPMLRQQGLKEGIFLGSKKIARVLEPKTASVQFVSSANPWRHADVALRL